MQIFDIDENRTLYEDRIKQLRKDYSTRKNKPARKPFTWLKKVLKRNDI